MMHSGAAAGGRRRGDFMLDLDMLDLDMFARGVLIATLGMVLVTELLNTGIEAVVDRVGSDLQALS